MSEKVNEQEVAKFEEWPLSKNWWLHIQSERGTGDFRNFDFIKISAQGPDNYSRPITSVMVPKIDGFVCESHSFISYLINQNLESLKAERDEYRAMLEEWMAFEDRVIADFGPHTPGCDLSLLTDKAREILKTHGVKEMGK